MNLGKGFTIVELIIVVVLVGVISVFAIPSYQKSSMKSQEKAVVNNVTIMYAAQKMIKATSGTYAACNTTSVCNTQLGLSIASDGFNYSCTGDATTFSCAGKRNNAPQFAVRVDNASNVACCVNCDGACPNVAVCAVVTCP